MQNYRRNIRNLSCIKIRMNIVTFTLLLLLSSNVVCSYASRENPVLQWERIRILPSLSVEQAWDDNIYREDQNEQADNITTISPAIEIDIGLDTRLITHLSYRYKHSVYREAENFKKDRHNAAVDINWRTVKGSYAEIGAKAVDEAVQPFSENDVSKDYHKLGGYFDSSLLLGRMWEIQSKYSYDIRRFEDDVNEEDNYDREYLSLGFLYKRSQWLPLLVKWDITNYQSDDTGAATRNMVQRRYYLGFQWKASERIEGELKMGYLDADFKEGESAGGFSTETELNYYFSEITTFQIQLNRTVVPSTSAERETGTYYENTFGAVNIYYDFFKPLRIVAGYSYRQKDFPPTSAVTDERIDRIIIWNGALVYRLKKSIDIELRYQYKRYDSDRDLLDYNRNRFTIGIKAQI